jgi:hypothetical protein
MADADEKPRFCAMVEIGEYTISGCGQTLEEARENLIEQIRHDEILFDDEKEQLIRQIKEGVV